MADTVISGDYPIKTKFGRSYWRSFDFFSDELYTQPISMVGKNVYIEVKDRIRKRVVKTYNTSITANSAVLDIISVDIPEGVYDYDLVVESGGRSNVYVSGKFTVSG